VLQIWKRSNADYVETQELGEPGRLEIIHPKRFGFAAHISITKVLASKKYGF
jgi:hypothetical protein